MARKRKRPPLTFGERLGQLRRQAGLAQEDLARLADVRTITIGSLEQGRRQPLFSTVCRLADALGVTTDDLRVRE